MPCYEDYNGVYFTIKSLQIYQDIKEVEFLVVDTNPDSEHGKETKRFCEAAKVRYIRSDVYGTAHAKQLIFENARTEFVLCMDCHVLLDAGVVQKLLKVLEQDDGNLLQGPLVYDDGEHISTHLDMMWRGGMEGIWGTDERGRHPEGKAFEIPAQGMGVFACRKDAWVGFNPLFRGFGGEEFYIHRKFRMQGKKVLCLPFLRWHHRFGRPGGQPYRNDLADRIFNYVIGHLETGLDCQSIRDHFVTILDPNIVDSVGADALEAFQEEEVVIQELCTA